MRSDAFPVQHRHHIGRGHFFDIERNQPFAGRVVGAADDPDPRHVGEARQVAGAVDHRIRQRFFMRVDGCAPAALKRSRLSALSVTCAPSHSR